MENQWYGRYTFDQVERIREKAKDDMVAQSSIRQLAGENNLLAGMIIDGPSEPLVEQLKKASPEDRIHAEFDNVWGAGAAEYYASYEPKGISDVLLELPPAVAHGVAGAFSEGLETFSNSVAKPVGYLMFGDRAEGAEKQVTMMENLVNRLTEQGADQVLIDDAHARLEAARVEDTRVKAMSDDELATYNSEAKVELDSNTILRGIIKEPETVTGSMVEGVIQFAAPFMFGMGGASKLRLVAETGRKGQIAASMLVGMVVDFAAFDDDTELVTTALSDALGVESEIVDKYFRHGEDDSDILKRSKRSIEGAGLSVALDWLLIGAAKVVKNYRAKKITDGAASAQIKDLLDRIDAEGLTGGHLDMAEVGELPWHLKATEDVSKGASEDVKAAASEDVKAAASEDVKAAASEDVKATASEDVKAAPKEDQTSTDSDIQRKPKFTESEHRSSIRKASQIYRDVRETVTESDAFQGIRDFLRTSTDNLAEASTRTIDELAAATVKPYREVMSYVRSGNLDAIRDFTSRAGDLYDIRVRSAALKQAVDVIRAETDRMVTLYDAAIASSNTTQLDRQLLDQMLSRQIEFAMEVVSLNENLGSAAGALLGQRAAHMDILEAMKKAMKDAEEQAEAAGKSERKVRKAGRDAVREAHQKLLEEGLVKKGTSNSGHLLDRYRELRKLGVDPRLAYDRVRSLAREAARSDVKLNPKVKRQADAAKVAAFKENETLFDKFLRGLEQWRYGAMLSGLKTHETNILSTLANTTSKLAYERAFGDKTVRLAASRKVTAMIVGAKESAIYALEAARQMRPLLDDVTMLERMDPVYRNMILTYPQRLMLMSDQFFKHSTYKGEVYASAMMDADLAGLTGQARTDFVNGRMSKAFDPETGAGTDMLAIDRAQSNTFQKHYSKDSPYASERFLAKSNELLSETAVGRLLFPFMRIYFRLTDEGIRMTPGLREVIAATSKFVNVAHGKQTGSSKFWDDLMGHNGKFEQARAYGEYSVGLALTGWAIALAAEGRITGGEPRNYIDADMRRKEIPPYSIRIGDAWYSYERFEPFSFPMKLWANTLIQLDQSDRAKERGEYETEAQEMMAKVAVTGYIFREALTNNSFMEGIESLVKATGGSYDSGSVSLARPLQTLLDSYVPNILQKVNRAMDEGNRYATEPLSLDRLKSHFSSVLDMSEVDHKRNMFTGEVVVDTASEATAGFTNFVGKEAHGDLVMQMLIDANENTVARMFLKRPTAFIDNEDLRKIKGDNGKTSLYDQYLETVSTIKVGGKTYRESLEELASSPAFLATEWGNKTRFAGAKVEAIRAIKKTYEANALKHMEQTSMAYAGLQAKNDRLVKKAEERQNKPLLEYLSTTKGK